MAVSPFLGCTKSVCRRRVFQVVPPPPLLYRFGKDRVWDEDGGLKYPQRLDLFVDDSDDLSAVGADDEKGEKYGKHTTGNDHTGEIIGDKRQWQAKAQKVWPIGLDEIEPFVKLQPLVEPLVFEAVEWMQQAQVQKVDQIAQQCEGCED